MDLTTLPFGRNGVNSASYVTDFVKEFSKWHGNPSDIFISADVAPISGRLQNICRSRNLAYGRLYRYGIPMAYGTNVIPLYSSFTVEAAGDRAYSYIGVSYYGVDVFKRQIVETREANDGFAFSPGVSMWPEIM